MPNAILKKAFLLATLMFTIPGFAQAEVVYNRGSVGDPSTLDPHKTSVTTESDIMTDLYEGLLEHTALGESVPAAADSWTISSDGLVYTFKLRTDGKWSNGEPVTAQDFVYSLRRIMNPATASRTATNVYPIKNAEQVNKGEMKVEDLGVRAIDDKTLEITLRAPTPYFLELLTHPSTFPVYAPAFEKHGAEWNKPGNLVSNGPFMLAENILKDHIKMVKNKFYREHDKIKIDVVNYIPIEDRGTGLKRFQAGEIHSYEDVPAEQLGYMKEVLKDELQIVPYLGTYYYSINTRKAPFNNPKLRRAIAMAIDRENLAEKIWGGTMTPAYSFVPPGIINYKSGEADYKNMSQLDREDEARKIMTELGYTKENPLKLEIRYNTAENHKNTAVAVADQLKNLNIEIAMVNVDAATHFHYLQEKGDFDLARAAWIADYNDPQNFLMLSQTGNGTNYSGYSNPEFDDLLRKAEAEIDQTKRMEYLHQAEVIIMRDAPLVPVMFYTSKSMVSRKLKGWLPNIISKHPSKYMSIEAS